MLLNKQLIKKGLFYILFFFISNTISAQTKFRTPNLFDGVAFRYTAFDYLSVYNNPDFNSFSKIGNGFEMALQKQVSGQFKVILPLKFGKTNAVYLNKTLAKDLKIMSADLLFQLYFLKKQPKFRPFLRTGFASTTQSYRNTAFQLPFGIGFDFQINPKLFLSFSSEYRFNGVRELDNLQHGIGIVFLFKPEKKDTSNWKFTKKTTPVYPDADFDGVPNEDDKCPYERGDIKLYGCPDNDGDGIPDKDDFCVEIFGLAELKGCPDKDDDGVSDLYDRCPDEAGKKDNFGCPIPDADDDGVLDDDDDCPNAAGKVENKGCPDRDNDSITDKDDACPDQKGLEKFAGCPDSDEDGVQDSEDECKDLAGVIENKGCPPLQKEEIINSTPPAIITDENNALVEKINKNLLFSLNKSTISSNNQIYLQEIANLLIQNPSFNIIIKGHTDNSGSRQANHILSEKRAKSVYEYLIELGVPANQLSYKGVGVSESISKNKPELNRRAELVLWLKGV